MPARASAHVLDRRARHVEPTLQTPVVAVERCRSALSERFIEFFLEFVLIGVIRSEVEVANDLRQPIQEEFKDVLLNEGLSNLFELVEIKFRSEMKDRIAVR